MMAQNVPNVRVIQIAIVDTPVLISPTVKNVVLKVPGINAVRSNNFNLALLFIAELI
jgi:hypothetical protein